eukprot:TRINITY_DN5892_c0_g2_i1.p1 TRINITY_DN5892_c0_g2~~TRINITY_DN5892_c0_g2_i1.p1  ORF type:complete len:948 (+),score=394.02 TRINITY_DN5892_c0_g2_i1:115-2958(+)
MSAKSEKSAVKVMVRVRPFNQRELGDHPNDYPLSIVGMRGGTVDLMGEDGNTEDSYDYHRAFWSIPESQKQFCGEPFADQEAVFQELGVEAVENAIKGFHTCIFAYGQTGSGKTHTMLGSEADPGLAPRLVEYLYDRMAEVEKKDKLWEYDVTVSFMEIYNEKVKDLLPQQMQGDSSSSRMKRRRSTVKKVGQRRRSSYVPSPSPRPDSDDEEEYADLRVRNSPEIGIFVEDLSRVGKEDGVATAADVIDVMRTGMEHRTTAATAMNATSSRSHAVFQLCIQAKNPSTGSTRYSHINIVDLAGSERIKMSKVDGKNLKEATKINLSLSTLRRVIDILIENSTSKKKQIPPYRESMLTWILSESLGGNSKTQMIATVSPAESNREDTRHTLRYALKAKSIINNARVNEKKGKGTLNGMQRELQLLREQLENSDEARTAAETEAMQEREKELLEEFEATKEDIEEEERRIEALNEDIEAQVAAREDVDAALEELAAENLEEQHAEEAERVAAIDAQREAELKWIRENEVEQQRKEAAARREAEERADVERKHMEQAAETADVDFDRRKAKTMMFREAFRNAFVINTRRAKQERLSMSVSQTQDAKNFGDIDAEAVNITIKETQFYNVQLQANIERVNDEVAALERSTGVELAAMKSKLRGLEEHAAAAAEEVREQEKQLARLQDAIRRVEDGTASPSRSASHESTLQSRLEAVKAKRLEGIAEARACRDNCALLRQLHTDITADNDSIREEIHEKQAAVASLRRENAALCDENRHVHTSLVQTTETTQDYKGDLASYKGRLDMQAEKADTIAKAHAALKEYARTRFFPTHQRKHVDKPAWIDEDLVGQTQAEADAHREWVGRGMRYKRQVSPTRTRSSSAVRERSDASQSQGAPRTPVSAFGRSTSSAAHSTPGSVRSSASRTARRTLSTGYRAPPSTRLVNVQAGRGA